MFKNVSREFLKIPQNVRKFPRMFVNSRDILQIFGSQTFLGILRNSREFLEIHGNSQKFSGIFGHSREFLEIHGILKHSWKFSEILGNV